MPVRRKTKRPTTPSPRKGVDDFVYIENTNFYIIQFGVKTPGKALAFAEALYTYQREFCFPIG